MGLSTNKLSASSSSFLPLFVCCWTLLACLPISLTQATAAAAVTVRDGHLFTRHSDGRVSIPDDLNEAEKEQLRQTTVQLLSAMYEQRILPFSSPRYPHTKGVLDRVPFERFLEKAVEEVDTVRLDEMLSRGHFPDGDLSLICLQPEAQTASCLEWAPYYKGWLNVTQPYMKKFKCSKRWSFQYVTTHSRVRDVPLMNPTLFARLDWGLAAQGLAAVAGKFSLIIMPQTMQYMPDPLRSAEVLFELLRPGGYLLFSSPFMQVVLPDPTDYYRFTAEGNVHLLQSAGFDIVNSYVGGDGFWSVCWLLRCGMTDLPPAALRQALRDQSKQEYDLSQDSYMLSMQIARKPWTAPA